MAGAVKVGIEARGAAQLQKALRVLGEPDAPFLRSALEQSGQELADAVKQRAPGGIGQVVQFTGVKGRANALRAVGRVKHPGARSMEFGRKYYYRGYTGRNVKSGQRVAHQPGQRARPFLGVVKGDQAIGATRERAQQRLSDAFVAEWERIGAEA